MSREVRYSAREIFQSGALDAHPPATTKAYNGPFKSTLPRPRRIASSLTGSEVHFRMLRRF
jgi:hypothetical protein